MTITWNIVTENMAWSKALEEKFRPKLTKLERHLNHFPPDAVHLLISLERTRKKSWYTAALTLRVPHNILRAAKSARDPLPAFDNAVKALQRELATARQALLKSTRSVSTRYLVFAGSGVREMLANVVEPLGL